MTLTINSDKCTLCGKCAKVCPSLVLQNRDKHIEVCQLENCIVCGHCAAVCAAGAVVHSEFPADKVHKVDYSAIPSAESLMMLIRARRSNRAFSKEPIPHAKLMMILEAAHRAPTASNAQNVSYTLIVDADKLSSVSQFTLDVFGSIVKKVTNPLVKPLVKAMMPDVFKYVPAFERLTEQYANGRDMIMRGATALILIHTPSKSRFGAQDANLAYQNGSLMAQALGVSQFYTGFVLSAAKQSKGRLEKMFGIEGTIHAGLALGMPQFEYTNYVDRKAIDLVQ